MRSIDDNHQIWAKFNKLDELLGWSNILRKFNQNDQNGRSDWSDPVRLIAT